MLTIKIPSGELYDEEKNEFIQIKEHTIRMEHSLISISKWESKWKKPFFGKEPPTDEEMFDYLKCMTITQNVPDEVYLFFTAQNIKLVTDYILQDQTATFVPNTDNKTIRGETVTSELVYYWMVACQIPWEAQTWHLSRLLTLINVCNFKNSPQKQMSTNELLSRNRALNAARRKQWNTKG